jgi:probable HAF family extracellular repeat protein
MKQLISATRLLTLAAAATLTASATSFQYTTIVDPGAYSTTDASGINDSGEIVGIGGTVNIFEGFLDNHGVFSNISASAYGTQALGINNSGEIVGLTFTNQYLKTVPFLDRGGALTLLNIFGSPYAQANGVNDSGEVVGYYNQTASPYNLEGFIYKNGTVNSIFVPGSFGTELFGVNDAGQIVGVYLDSVGGSHPFLYSNGSFIPIVLPSNLQGSYVTGINNRGEIVGYGGNGIYYESFLDNNGTFTTFSLPGSYGTEAMGINDEGQIVGSYFDSQGGHHAFLATPAVPEPASAMLIAVALVPLAGWRLRRIKRMNGGRSAITSSNKANC